MTGLDIPNGDESQKTTTKKKSNNFNNSFESFFDMEKTRMYLTTRVSKYTDRITLDTIRPLPVFLGITGPSICFAPDAFTPPTKKIDKDTAEKVSRRVSLNIAYFLSNYAMIFIGTCIIVTLLHPGMIIYSLLVYFLWKGHTIMVDNNTPMKVKDVDLGQYITVEMRTRVLYAITIWVVIAKCFKPFVIVVGLTGMLVLFHAFMRDPKHIEANRLFMEGMNNDESDSSCGSDEVVVEKMDAV